MEKPIYTVHLDLFCITDKKTWKIEQCFSEKDAQRAKRIFDRLKKIFDKESKNGK